MSGLFNFNSASRNRDPQPRRKCRTKICSRSRVKKNGSSGPWADLPEAIVELFVNKLHLRDQFRALAVCKNWQLCKDYIKCSDQLPWVVSYERKYSTSTKRVEFVCELFDPYSQEIVSRGSMDINSGLLYIKDSRHGRLLLADEEMCLFLHNPFTNERIYLPLSVDIDNMQAVISASPTSPECEIFMLSVEDDLYLNLKACYLQNHGTDSTEIEETDGIQYIHSMLCMEGDVFYVLLENQVLNTYVLNDGAPELLASGFPEPYESNNGRSKAWLLEIDENLIMVRMERQDKEYAWIIFRLDWSEMSWVVETNLKKCAIYINSNVAFSAPLTNNCEDAKLFYLDEYGDRGMEIIHYSLNEAGVTRIQSSEYGWINNYRGREWSFIEPSYYSI